MKVSVLFLVVFLLPATAFLPLRTHPRVSVKQFAYSGVNRATSTNPPPTPTVAKRPEARRAKELWESTVPVIIHGSSLRTWSFANPNVERVQILLRTEGRPMHANIDLWHGPDNTPQKIALYIEDGALRPFHVYVETPRSPNAVAVYNTATRIPFGGRGGSRRVDGTITESTDWDDVALLLKTDGRPLNARIELLQGPNNNKQVMEVFSEDGLERPFYVVLETPGSGNVVRIVNTATMEFPLTAYLEPVVVDSTYPPGRFW
ncbi:hypothetical protein FisN_19Lh260 [Fistulifera solaris]|uniref:Uncharacterized protein n=1 Tax=Fistulifera solaris TaxID=1519565 RepID=A0A1Z5K7K0_FISSO|nr:hypothetical protein FisN_19Lh260 [Fistulifera solaris]|eukprot:GAX22196.1 hypothetical protein FisN_19Lh260 [Fistulifera solaris]